MVLKKEIEKNKPNKDEIFMERLGYIYYCVFFNFLATQTFDTGDYEAKTTYTF